MPIVQKILSHDLASSFPTMNLDLATGWRIVSVTVIPPQGVSGSTTAFVLEKDMSDDERDAYVTGVKEERSRR